MLHVGCYLKSEPSGASDRCRVESVVLRTFNILNGGTDWVDPVAGHLQGVAKV